MQEMQAQDAQFVGEVVEFDGQPLPQMHPVGQVPVEQLVEPAESGEPALGVDSGFGRRDIAPGVDGHDLLDRHRVTDRQSHRDVVTDFGGLVEQAVGSWDGTPVAPHGASRRHGDGNARLSRLHGQQHRIVGDLPLVHRREMLVGQVPVALDQRVRHVAVQGRANLDRPRPVLGDDRRLEGTDVGQVHRDESSLRQ